MTDDFHPDFNSNEPAWEQYERHARQAENDAMQFENKHEEYYSNERYDEAIDCSQRAAEYWFRAARLYSRAKKSVEFAIRASNRSMSDAREFEKDWKNRFGVDLPRDLKEINQLGQRRDRDLLPRLSGQIAKYSDTEAENIRKGNLALASAIRVAHRKLLGEMILAHRIEELNAIVAGNIKSVTPEFIKYLDAICSSAKNETSWETWQHFEWIRESIGAACERIYITENPDLHKFIQSLNMIDSKGIRNFLLQNRERFGDVFLVRLVPYIEMLLHEASASNTNVKVMSDRLNSVLQEIRILKGEEKPKSWLQRLLGR